MTDTTVAYIAGLFDGEGSILISTRIKFNRPVFWLEISITNTDLSVITWLHETCGGRIAKRPNLKNPLRPVYRWLASSRAAATFLETLMPYMRIKREEAEIAIGFQRLLSLKDGFKTSTPAEIAVLADHRERLLAFRRAANISSRQVQVHRPPFSLTG